MSDNEKQETSAGVRFGWFAFGVVLAFGLFVVFGLFLDQGLMAKTRWRECAPAPLGSQLVSATQYEDRVDCFYESVDPKYGFRLRTPKL
jgi:hypothetical protein